VDAFVFNPAQHPAGKKGDRARLHTIACSAADRCELRARGQCTLRRPEGTCQHGERQEVDGPTQRADNYYRWIQEQQEKAAKIGRLQPPPVKLAFIGDSVWLPYKFMSVVLDPAHFTPRGSTFVPVARYTPEFVARLCEARPRGFVVDGELLASYQRAVRLFVAHLSEARPELLAAAALLSPRIREILPTLTKVGRKALLRTVRPNVGDFEGWTWDGTHMATSSRSAMPASSPFGAQEMRVLPAEDAVVKIASDAQVGPDTVFVD
jgi:hypothetical protein